jgi:hypothetical protein
MVNPIRVCRICTAPTEANLLSLTVVDAYVQVRWLLEGCDQDLNAHTTAVRPGLGAQGEDPGLARWLRRFAGVVECDLHGVGDYISIGGPCHLGHVRTGCVFRCGLQGSFYVDTYQKRGVINVPSSIS